jgi:hypothetical protein
MIGLDVAERLCFKNAVGETTCEANVPQVCRFATECFAKEIVALLSKLFA